MYKITKTDGSKVIIDGDGYYLTPKGDLNIYQSSDSQETEVEEIVSLDQLLLPTVNIVVASFASGRWVSIYQIEEERLEH